MIRHQQRSLQTIPEFIAEQVNAIETPPFDATTLDIDASSPLIRGKPISFSEIYDELALLKGRSAKMNRNFVMVYISKISTLFKDKHGA